MPQVIFDFTKPAGGILPNAPMTLLANSERIGVYRNGDFQDPSLPRLPTHFLRLSRLDESIEPLRDVYHRHGTFFQDYGTVHFDGDEVSGLLGFRELLAEDIPGVTPGNTESNDGRAIEYQISVDDATYSYWNGSAWTTASNPAHWNTWDDIDLNLPTFQYVSDLYIRIRLTPSTDGSQTPKLCGVVVYLNYRTNYLEDVGSSFARHLRTADIILYDKQILSGDSTMTIVSDYGVATSNLTAYNLTDDPGKKTDLVSSFDAPTKVITLTGAQTGTVIACYSGILPVTVGENDICPDNEKPTPGAILIFDGGPGGEWTAPGAQCLDEDPDYAITKGEGYLRGAARIMATPMTVIVQEYNTRAVAILQEAVENILQGEVSFDSYGTAQKYYVLSSTPIDNGDIIGDGLHVRTFKVILIGKRWLGSSATHKLVNEVRFVLGNFDEQFEEETLDATTPKS